MDVATVFFSVAAVIESVVIDQGTSWWDKPAGSEMGFAWMETPEHFLGFRVSIQTFKSQPHHASRDSSSLPIVVFRLLGWGLHQRFDPAQNGFRIRPSSWLEIPGFLGDHVGRCLNCLYLSISKSNRCWFIQFRTLICIYLLNYIISSYPNASLKPRSFNKFQQGPDLIWTSAVGMQQTSALNLSALIMLHLLLVGVGSVVRFGLNWAGWF